MLSAGILNNYWKFVNVSAMIIESHKYLFPVTRYMDSKVFA
jgi:hypothetical protein